MLGEIAVTVVFFESEGLQNTEDWNDTHRSEVKQSIEEGLAWWQEMLALQTDRHTLDFVLDYTYADTPIPIGMEPIQNTVQQFTQWTGAFLDYVQADRTGDIADDVRLFNHQQRLAVGTDWAFTIFVLNSEAQKAEDTEGLFPGGQGAFSIAGGAFMATPSTRPASTIAHEVAHQFWAMDEYSTYPDYYAQRGYYNTQNTNSTSNNPTDGPQVTSLMGKRELLQTAYAQYTTSVPSLESIGWRDSDGDGIFDVLDVPLHFSASAMFDPDSSRLTIVGQGRVGVLPNLNSSGLQNSITTNRISHVEFSVDGSSWQMGPVIDAYEAQINFSLDFPDANPAFLEFRLVDESGYIHSEIFTVSTDHINSSSVQGFSGSLVHDIDRNGEYTIGERGLAGWTITVTDFDGTPIASQTAVEPDAFGQAHIFEDEIPGIMLVADGTDVNANFKIVSARNSSLTSTGGRAFFSYNNGSWVNQWSAERYLRIEFDSLTSRVAIDAVGDSVGDIGHLELYDANNNLLGRYTTSPLAVGEAETMVVDLPVAAAKYAIARGHVSHRVVLDNLQVGRSGIGVTNDFGAFSLPFDQPGEYQLVATPPPGDLGAFDSPLPVVVSLGASGGSTRASLSVTTNSDTWHNGGILADINDDGLVSPLDLDILLTELETPQWTESAGRFAHTFTTEHALGTPFLDVDGDGQLSTVDLLKVLNRIREVPPPAEQNPEPLGMMLFIPSNPNEDYVSNTPIDHSVETEPAAIEPLSDTTTFRIGTIVWNNRALAPAVRVSSPFHFSSVKFAASGAMTNIFAPSLPYEVDTLVAAISFSQPNENSREYWSTSKEDREAFFATLEDWPRGLPLF